MGCSSCKITDDNETKHAKVKEDENITISNNILLLEKAESSVCKIKIDDKLGNGFFCKFRYYNNDMIYLVTCRHVITEKILECYDELELIFNKSKIKKN